MVLRQLNKNVNNLNGLEGRNWDPLGYFANGMLPVYEILATFYFADFPNFLHDGLKGKM